MTKEEAINSLRKMAFKSHPLNIENDCVNLERAIELVEELFEQKLNIHGVMQAEGSDGAKVAAVASEGQGEANTCAGRAVCPKCGKNFYAVTKLWNHLDRCSG